MSTKSVYQCFQSKAYLMEMIIAMYDCRVLQKDTQGSLSDKNRMSFMFAILWPTHTSNCQCAACSNCFAWSWAQPAASTNWLIITCSLNESISGTIQQRFSGQLESQHCSNRSNGSTHGITSMSRERLAFWWRSSFEFKSTNVLAQNLTRNSVMISVS